MNDPNMRLHVIKTTVTMWKDDDGGVRQSCILLILDLYEAGVEDVIRCFSPGTLSIIDGSNHIANKNGPEVLDLVGIISNLLNDKEYEEKEILQKLWLFHISRKNTLFRM
jgi:hypothetical protein